MVAWVKTIAGHGTMERPKPSAPRKLEPPMDLALLHTLKSKLTFGTEFQEAQSYFFDHFAEDEEFLSLGARFEDPFLKSLLETVAAQLFGRETKIDDLLLIRLKEQYFIHGNCFLGGRVATILYFEDVEQGLLSIIWSMSPPETRFVRFSRKPMTRRAEPSLN
jgi:hypothetical protein